MDRWSERPASLAILAFIAGVVAAVVVVVIIILARGGDDDGGQPKARPTAETTPIATGTGPPGTPVAGFADPDEALNAFIRDEFGREHAGACPQDPSDTTSGVCSQELYRSDQLVTLLIRAPSGGFFGEAVLAPDDDGLWGLEFIPAPPLGEPLAVGIDAVVYGAGSCLNFRDAPGLSGERLSCRFDGTRAEVVEGPMEADEITWWRLEDLGWATGEFLVPASGGLLLPGELPAE